MLCREGDVEANVSLQFHAKFKSCLLIFDAVCTVSAFSLVQGCNTFSFVLRTIVVYSCLERCPCPSRTRSCWFRPTFGRLEFVFFFYCCKFSFFRDCRVDSRLVTIAHLLTHPVFSVGVSHGGTVGFKDVSSSRLEAEALTQLSVLMKLL